MGRERKIGKRESGIFNFRQWPKIQMPKLMASAERGGFTLTELLVVITIIGILSGLVAANLATARAKARDNQRQVDAAAIATALELYRSIKKSYPKIPTSANSWNALKAELYPTYISAWPTDPKGIDGVFGSGYVYVTNGANEAVGFVEPGEHFYVDVALERTTEETAPQIGPVETSATDPAAFTTGTYRSPTTGKIHYRIAR